jgi:ribosomal protein L37E
MAKSFLVWEPRGKWCATCGFPRQNRKGQKGKRIKGERVKKKDE